MTKRKLTSTLIFTLLTLLVAGCNFVQTTTTAPIETLTPAVTSTPNPQTTPVGTPITPDTGWLELRPGLERRSIQIFGDQNQVIESLYILRIDQSQYRFDVAFSKIPQTLEGWQRETKAEVVVNGGYYRIENDNYYPTGLIVIDGQAAGVSFADFAGMLAINENGAELRWLADQPYDPGEPLQAALQSFPILVKPGGELGFAAENEDNIQARRTVIGQDRDGNILFIIANRGYFTLHQISAYLTASDLNLDIAMNLDGGPSSGILVDEPQEGEPTQISLPFVILVYQR